MDSILRSRVREMNEDQLVEAIYKDTLTGVGNRLAFETIYGELDGEDFVAIIDLDSLKWLNDHCGHHAGDSALVHLANILGCAFPSVFRLSGDEFVAVATTVRELERGLQWAAEQNDIFSYGIGRNLDGADEALRRNKKARVKDGLRAPRGETPAFDIEQFIRHERRRSERMYK